MKYATVLWISICLMASATGQAWKGKVGDMDALKVAAKTGDPAAMAEVSFCIFYCMGGMHLDEELMYDYASKSAAAGDPLGMEMLSSCYSSGIGVKVDHDKVFEWAKKSADLGHSAGLRRLGSCYQFGTGVGVDMEKASALYQESAEAGNIIARWSLANNLANRPSGPEDFRRAYSQFRELAVDFDHYYSYESMQWMIGYKEVESEKERDLEMIIKGLQSHADRGQYRAIYRIAVLRRQELGDDEYVAQVIASARLGAVGGLMGLSGMIGDTVHPGWEFPIRAGHGTMRGLYRQSVEHGNLSSSCVLNQNVVKSYVTPCKNLTRDYGAARKICYRFLERGHGHYHDQLWRIYADGLRRGVPEFEKADLAIAHCIYYSRESPTGAENVEWVCSGRLPGFKADLPKAYAACLVTIQKNHKKNAMTKKLNELKRKMTPEQIKQAEALKKSGFPSEGKHFDEAVALLKANGVPINPSAPPIIHR